MSKKTRRRSQKRRDSLNRSVIVGALFLVFGSMIGISNYVLAGTTEPTINTENIEPNFHVKTLVTQFFEDNDAAEMIPIIKCESNFRHYNDNGELLRNRAGSSAIGVAQIMSSVHPNEKIVQRYNKINDTDFTVDDFDITTLEGNLGYALVLYSVNGTRDWECSKKFRW